MKDCRLLDGCPFFNEKMTRESAIGSMFLDRFCHRDWSACARFKVLEAAGKDRIPVDLYPNMHARAERIIVAHEVKACL